MKINNDIYNHIARLYQGYQMKQTQAEPAETKPAANAAAGDSVQLSGQAVKINGLVKAARELPDTREEKVARIKEEIAGNTYKVSAREVAEKMLAKDRP